MHASYLWTYDFYNPVHNAFDVAKSIMRASEGVGPWKLRLYGSFEMASRCLRMPFEAQQGRDI
jgi:hypothetical protein